MDSADMVDVLHYFFDEDMRYASFESAQMHGKFREQIYKSLYDQKYVYSIGSGEGSASTFSPDGTEIKPYIPPTEFDEVSGLPLTNSLDAPLG